MAPEPRAISAMDRWDTFGIGPLRRSGRRGGRAFIVPEVPDDQAERSDDAEDSGAEAPAARNVRHPVHLEDDPRAADGSRERDRHQHGRRLAEDAAEHAR